MSITRTLKKHNLSIELGLIFLIQILLLGAIVTDIYAAGPWLSVMVTMAGLWLLPGYILWRLTGPESLPAWFYWLPVSFGLGLAWLMIPVLIAFFFEFNMALLVKITLTGNSLLVFLYIILRFTGRLPWPAGKKSRDKQSSVNWWLVVGAAITLIIILYLYFDAAGLSFDSDVTRLMGQVRMLLGTAQFKFTPVGISLWNFIIGLVVSVSGVNLLDTYILYLSAIMIIVAGLNQLMLAHTLFQNKNKAYFAFIIFGLYFISDIHFDSKGAGVGLFFRLMEDKYFAWLLVLPLAQTFFLRYLQTKDNRFLPLFGLISLTAVLIHPIAITWLGLSIGGVWLMHMLFQPNRRILYGGLGVAVIAVLLLIPFGLWTAIPGLEKGANLPAVDPMDGLRALSFRRVLVLSAEQNQYLVHPLMLSHPMVITAIGLCLVLLFRLKRSLAAQFLFSNIGLVLLLLFNPLTAPLVGGIIQYWQIYRIVWMLPVSLTLAYVLYDLPLQIAVWLNYRPGRSRIIDFSLGLVPLLLVLVMAGLLKNQLILSVRTLYAWHHMVVSTAAERELASFITEADWPENSVAIVSRDPSFTYRRLPLLVPSIRFSYPDWFSELEMIDQAAIDYLQKKQVDYLVVNRNDPLDGYIQLLPKPFLRLFRNSNYSVYAWSPEAITPAETKLWAANQAFTQQKFDLAQNLFTQILAQEPAYTPALLGMGLTLAATGKPAEAIPFFQQAIQINPDEPLLQLKLARAIQDTPAANGEEALALYQAALKLNPEAGWLYRKVLDNFLLFPPAEKNTAEANALIEQLITFFQAYTRTAPNDYPRQQQLATVYEQLGQVEAAIAQYDRMKKLFPGQMQPYLNQANLYIAQGDTAQAEQVYLQAIDNLAQPDLGQVYSVLADFYLRQQNYQSALSMAQRFLEEAASMYHLGEANLQLARVYRAMGQPDRAEHYYGQALETMAYFAPAHAELGGFYESLGNFDLAISHYRQAIALHPENEEYNYRLGAALLKIGKPYAGLEVLRQAHAFTPRSDKIKQLLGETLLTLGEAQEARDYLKDAVALNPQNAVAQTQLQQALTQIDQQTELPQHWFDTGYVDLFSDPGIVPILKNAIEQGAIARETFISLLARQVRADQSAEMEAFFQAMVQVLPEDEDIYFYWGEMYRYRGDFALAKGNYEAAIKLNPAFSPAYLKLGIMAETTALTATVSSRPQYLKEALTWYQQYYNLNPTEPLGLKKQLGVLRLLDDPQATAIHQQLLAQLSQAGPQVIVNQTLENGWTFMGYRGDEPALAQDCPAELWLFWQGLPGHEPGQEAGDWYALGENRWVQSIDEAQNLLVNGNFESGLTFGAPTGFSTDIYQAPPATRQAIITTRSGITTTVAMLDNTKVATRTSLATPLVTVDDQALYLQAGWMLSPEGNAFLGRRWFAETLPAAPLYDFVASEVRSTAWNHFAGVAVPPAGASDAEIWLLNPKTTGPAFFDDVLFIKINSPERINQE